jgi:amino acid permease
MISEKDMEFMAYWERVRESENTFASKIGRGLPMAVLFGLPIILSVIVVRIFAPDWYMKMSATSPGAFITIIIAMMIIIVFYAYFRMQYKWEMNDQLYNEIKSKHNKTQTLN